MKIVIMLLLMVVMAIACKKEKTVDQKKADEDIITKYISDNKLAAQPTGSGLYYVIATQGTGIQPTINSNVTVNYKGYLTNGTVFDQTGAGGLTFGLNSVIKGWQEGIPLFKKGGKGMLLIPSALGYGNQAQGNIPANSVLIFDISLLDVK